MKRHSSNSPLLLNRKAWNDPLREILRWLSGFLSKYLVPKRLVPFTVDSLGFWKHVDNDTRSGKRGTTVIMKKTRNSTVKMSFLVRNLSPRDLSRGTVSWRTPISDVQLICVRLSQAVAYREQNIGEKLSVRNLRRTNTIWVPKIPTKEMPCYTVYEYCCLNAWAS